MKAELHLFSKKAYNFSNERQCNFYNNCVQFLFAITFTNNIIIITKAPNPWFKIFSLQPKDQPSNKGHLQFLIGIKPTLPKRTTFNYCLLQYFFLYSGSLLVFLQTTRNYSGPYTDKLKRQLSPYTTGPGAVLCNNVTQKITYFCSLTKVWQTLILIIGQIPDTYAPTKNYLHYEIVPMYPGRDTWLIVAL